MNMKAVKTQKKTVCAFILPSLIGTIIFFMIPYADVFRRSFFTTATGEFVGLRNFTEVLNNEAFRLAMKNTGLFIVVCVPLLLVFSLAIAVFLHQHAKSGKWMQTGFLIPMAIPVASIVLVWKLMFDRNGFLNGALQALGIEGVDWMNTDFAFWVLVLSYIWKNLGYNIILWIAGLTTIPSEIHEAARIDGAGSWQCFRRITLPNLLPSLFVISVLALLNSFKVFREAYLVAGEYPHESMYMIQHLFNNWFRDLSLDKMAAGAALDSLILIVFILLLQKLWDRKGDSAT